MSNQSRALKKRGFQLRAVAITILQNTHNLGLKSKRGLFCKRQQVVRSYKPIEQVDKDAWNAAYNQNIFPTPYSAVVSNKNTDTHLNITRDVYSLFENRCN